VRKIIPAIVLVLALIFGYPVAKPIGHEMTSKSAEASEVSKLIGATIKDPQAEDLGKIIDIGTGPKGRVALEACQVVFPKANFASGAIILGADASEREGKRDDSTN